MSLVERVLIYVVTIAHLSACATPPVPTVSEAQRSQMGTVGVISLASATQGELAAMPGGSRAGAGFGAATGAAASVAPFASLMCGPAAMGCLLLLPMALAGGAIGGLVGAEFGPAQTVPGSKAGEIEAQLRAVLAEVGPQGKLRFAVVDAAARAGVQGVTEITAGTTTLAGQVVDYRQLPDAKVDRILEVGVVSVGMIFIGGGEADPLLTLRVGAVARLVDARNSVELFRSHAFTHATGPRRFSEWGANGARLLKEALERACGSIGQSMMDEIFLVVRTN